MEEENRAYILNLENLIGFIYQGDNNDKNYESELTELYVVDNENSNMSLSNKQLRELKNNDMTNHQTIRYDMIKLLLERLLDIKEEVLTFGETVVLNTMLTEGLITEIKESDI